MSAFENLLTPKAVRRRLFYLICIWVRLLIAVTFFLGALLWEGLWPNYVASIIGILGGLFFGLQHYVTDAISPNVWWSRRVHSLIWASGGGASLGLTIEGYKEASAYTLLAVFTFDVAFGLCFALWTPRFDTPVVKNSREPLITVERIFSRTDSNPACFTPWSLVHAVATAGMGAIAYAAFPGDPYILCLLGTFFIYLWEAYENTFVESVQRFPFLHGRTEPDSAINMLSDILVGNFFLWGTAYLLYAVV